MFRGSDITSDGSLPFRDHVRGSVNTPHSEIYANIRRNIRLGLPQVDWHKPNTYKVALLCGGPSLRQSQIPRGYKVATCNGTYPWALARGYKPSVYVTLDAREFNTRFVRDPLPNCKYLVCSQAHPAVFDALAAQDVYIWHAASKPEKRMLDRYYLKRWRNIPGGCTVGSRAIFLLYMLGIRTIRVLGMDCSFARGKHHAYRQSENDTDDIRVVKVGRRRFRASWWMLAQLDELLQLAPKMPDDLKISFEGDGLWQHVILETHKRGVVPEIKVEK